MTFSERLCLLRTELGLTQKDVYSAIGVAPIVYQRYEYGRLPSYENLIALADFFEVPMDFLVGRGVFENASAILEHRASITEAIYSFVSLPEGIIESASLADYLSLVSAIFARIQVREDGAIELFPKFPPNQAE